MLSVVAVPTKWHDAIPQIPDFALSGSGSMGRLEALRDGAVAIVSEALFFRPEITGSLKCIGMSFVLLFSGHGHDCVH